MYNNGDTTNLANKFSCLEIVGDAMKGEERPKFQNKNRYRDHLWRAKLRTA